MDRLPTGRVRRAAPIAATTAPPRSLADRIQLGMNSVLAGLEATGDWRAVFDEVVVRHT